ncbi:hypothetical protein [Streptomyces sp. KN37]|uniref:hypothetical protein n=1 Tax=Streptomyces sp. KN37 TaxID=3090667 RepID=UPI002A74B1B8|nr:hypothetical protein [Streptomyces sp. KN37]WPO74044.1 hypothetical protein R9806_27195 [Streptomyces sp. KN37]
MSPEARPVRRRVDESAGDIASLVSLGLADPQPTPAPPPEPTPVPDVPTPEEQANELLLQEALVTAGVGNAAGDEAVIDALARLEPTEVQAVARWLKTKKPDPETK